MMLSTLFAKLKKPKNIYRCFNAYQAGAIAYNYMKTPGANPYEYIPDIALHFAEAAFPHSCDKLMMHLNFSRFFSAAYSAITQRFASFTVPSTFSKFDNITDAFIHALIVKIRGNNIGIFEIVNHQQQTDKGKELIFSNVKKNENKEPKKVKIRVVEIMSEQPQNESTTKQKTIRRRRA